MIHGMSTLTDRNGRFLIKSYFSTAGIRQNLFRIHHHAECELSAIIKGSGLYRTRDKTYTVGAGDVFLFSGDEEHCITDIYEECEILNIHFVPRLLWADGDLSLSRIFFARSAGYQNKIDPENPATKRIFDSIIRLEEELSSKRDGHRQMAKYLLLGAICDIVREYDYIDRSVDFNTYAGKVRSVERALKHIEEHLTEKITLEELAEVANMAPTYFSTVFKKLNGISPWEYINAKRIDLAIELLQTTDMTKLDIAMQCGYNTSSNFYKAFFSVTGKRPKDYVRQ